MCTELQIEASRANGSKSRSDEPVRPYPFNTEAESSTCGQEGKLASSCNAVKHGILSAHVLLRSEKSETFLNLVASLWDEFRPATAFEESLVDAMAVARWRQQRIWNIERDAMDSQLVAEHDKNRAAMLHPGLLTSMAFGTLASETRTLDLINRYESRFDRQYLRAHNRLVNVQERRMRNEPDNTPPPAPGPQLVPSAPISPSEFAKGTQAESENAENKAPGTEPTAATTPVARRSFYLAALPPDIFHPAPPENPAVFHAGTAASHP
jgi:hypothetical protein